MLPARQVRTSPRFSEQRRPSSLLLPLNLRVNSRTRSLIREIVLGLPQLSGNPISIYTRPKLIAHRGKLLSACLGYGTPVYAASFVRKREIVLETGLLAAPRLFRLIVVHEIFHFVWTRLSHRSRKEFVDLLSIEIRNGARGELGESASVKKNLLVARGDWPANSRLWRDYVCESFCDTAAWLYAGIGHHSSFTLAKRWRRRRQAWFQAALAAGCEC